MAVILATILILTTIIVVATTDMADEAKRRGEKGFLNSSLPCASLFLGQYRMVGLERVEGAYGDIGQDSGMGRE